MNKAPKAADVSAELIVNEWAPDGVCSNPERIEIPLAKDRKLTLELAAAPDGSWRSGYLAEAKAGDESRKCKLAGDPWPARGAALGALLEEVKAALKTHGDKAGIKALEAFAAALGEKLAAAVADKPAANPVAALGALPLGAFARIPVANIQANPENPRKHFDAIAMRELADSIATQGQLQPIAVRRMLPEELGENAAIAAAVPPERYEIILGERRWRAFVMLSQERGEAFAMLEAKVYEGVTRAQAKAAALVENLQREKMNPIEEAEGYRDLINSTTPPLTQEQAAAIVGKSRPVVANALRVLELPLVVLEHIRAGKLTIAHGVALARFRAYPQVVSIMAEEAIREEMKAGELERGVPFYWALNSAGLAVQVGGYGIKLPAAIKKHPAYFPIERGGAYYICLEPAHWESEKKRIEEEQAEQERREQEKAAAALKKAAAKGGKLKELSELDRDQFRKLEGAEAALLELVPEDRRAMAKDYDGAKVEIVTDVTLAERLAGAMKREIKKDRRHVTETTIGPAVRSSLSKIKKLGSREMAFLLAELVTYPGRELRKEFSAEACKAAGIKQPAAFRDDSFDYDDPEEAKGKMPQIVRELRALERLDSVTLFRVIAEERLADALEAIVEHGPDTPSAYFVRWLLERDELGLLEETEEGRNVLLGRVKAAKWYQSEVVGGEAPAADEAGKEVAA